MDVFYKFLSDVVSLLNGVIQGSGIGHVLFLTYINELANILESYGVHVKLFADDVKLYIQITNDADVGRLQRAIDALTDWADAQWQMSGSIGYQWQSTNAVCLTLGELSVIQTLPLTNPFCQLFSQRMI